MCARRRTTADVVARESLSLERLRTGHRDAIEAVRDGRDVLAVMPTGYGKSAIYQVAAVLRPGPTVVVSPLIALQRSGRRPRGRRRAPRSRSPRNAAPCGLHGSR